MISSDHSPKASRLTVQNCRKSEVFIYHDLSCKDLLQPLNNRTIDGSEVVNGGPAGRPVNRPSSAKVRAVQLSAKTARDCLSVPRSVRFLPK
jgi:hypothetical protein